MIYIQSNWRNDLIVVDPTTLVNTAIPAHWVNVAVATIPGQLLDYAGILQTVNVGDLLFIGKSSISLLPTVFDFITNVIMKDENVETTNTQTTPTSMNITLTGVATSVVDTPTPEIETTPTSNV